MMDELARMTGRDPVAFRLEHLADYRARDVITAAVEEAGPLRAGLGRGVAVSQYKNRQSYLAVVVDLEVDRETGHIRLIDAVLAVDAGEIVNPDGLANQAAGAFTQSASWTLKERVTYARDGITSVDWHTYPILRLDEAPLVRTVLLDRPGFPSLGIGEGAQGPASAAIANAIHDAVGVRLREIPFTPDGVKQALGRTGS
jgi:CO/xanthine dehydrogenase Mo-binding subunit